MKQFCFPSVFNITLSLGLLMSLPQQSAAGEIIQQLTPETGISAHIEKSSEGYVLMQPGGSKMSILTADFMTMPDVDISLKTEDYDYDGYTDLALGVREAGSLDIGSAVFLYDPKEKIYSPLIIEDALAGKLNCGELWNIERLPERKAIKSSCSLDGHYSRTDILMLDAHRNLWLTEQSRPEEDMSGWPYLIKPMRMVRYDPQGNILLETPLPGFEMEEMWEVPVNRLALYNQPDPKNAAEQFLNHGDQVRKLAFAGNDWMKIALPATGAQQEYWVSLKETYDLRTWLAENNTKSQPMQLSLFDYSQAESDPDYYKHLFTLVLRNNGSENIQLNYSEVHLLFTATEGKQILHKLYDIYNTTLEPDEKHMLDDNPVEQRSGNYVIYHETAGDETYLPFFPKGLAEGRYKIRPVLTSNSLTAPVFSADEIEMDYPPKLPASLIAP